MVVVSGVFASTVSAMEAGAGGGFWRRGGGALPGRPMMTGSGGASFREFAESVRDAWEVDDEELGGAGGLHSQRQAQGQIERAAALSAAWDVLESHKRSIGKNRIRASSTQANQTDKEAKVGQFTRLAAAEVLDADLLKQLSWSGIPAAARAVTWRLLSGYVPPIAARRAAVLARRRADYFQLVKQYYEAERDADTHRQIHIDVPRMSPLLPLFQQPAVQELFERVLYIWAIRHPASGYVQGINDLVTPFFMVFLQEAAPPGSDLDNYPLDSLTEEQRRIIEADSFWCLSKFLDSIQDNYIFAQLGIQHKVNQLKELIRRIDLPLHQHLQNHGVDYLQFSFRWMNNLLTRELPLSCTIRLWDTYLAESDGFATFQLYVCAAFLLYWRSKLMEEKDFQGLMILLQNVPTQNWNDSHISMLVAEAYRLKFAFADAPNHLQSPANNIPQNSGKR